MCSLTRAGSTDSLKHSACRAASSPAVSSVFSRISVGCRPLALSTGSPADMRRIRPATRTMKNSSRLLAKMARNRTRSSSGMASSSASSSTRWLNRSQLSSRSRYRSGGSSSLPAGRTWSAGPPGRPATAVTSSSWARRGRAGTAPA